MCEAAAARREPPGAEYRVATQPAGSPVDRVTEVAAGLAWLGASPDGTGLDQARSNRSRFMTLTHAATKSRTNFSFASSLA